MNNKNFTPSKPAKVSVGGFLVNTQFHFQIVDVWDAGYGNLYVFIKDPAPAVQELMNHVSMWGGPSKEWGENIREVYGYEIHKDHLPFLRTLIERTKVGRPDDDVAAIKQIMEIKGDRT